MPLSKFESLPLAQLISRSSELVITMLKTGIEKKDVLAKLTGLAEELSGSETTASILYLDNDGLLRNGSSPKLPQDYLSAIDKIKPHPNLGTCASAAATGEVTITKSFLADDKWAELRHLPMSIGYKSAWSTPIKNSSGKVLGTFGIYFRDCREPKTQEIAGMKLLAAAAALALSSV
jgi:GAF domain-containing protein